MRIAGVIDLLGGHAVHARAGDRQRYAPVATVAGDPLLLARRYLEAGVTDLYVADLNAILARPRHDAIVETLAALGAPLWLDAGATSIAAARHCLDIGAAHAIVGLETLTSFDALRAICDDVGGARVAFSLDLRQGELATRRGGPSGPPEDLVRLAANTGVGTIIVLDLARVGTSSGIDVQLVAAVRAAAPRVTLLAGGGIRGIDDLTGLAAAGCDGALVATALHDGRLGPEEIGAIR